MVALQLRTPLGSVIAGVVGCDADGPVTKEPWGEDDIPAGWQTFFSTYLGSGTAFPDPSHRPTFVLPDLGAILKL